MNSPHSARTGHRTGRAKREPTPLSGHPSANGGTPEGRGTDHPAHQHGSRPRRRQRKVRAAEGDRVDLWVLAGAGGGGEGVNGTSWSASDAREDGVFTRNMFERSFSVLEEARENDFLPACPCTANSRASHGAGVVKG
jgi:hypothetical protein